MSSATAKFVQHAARKEKAQAAPARRARYELPPRELAALHTLQREAKEAGATLAHEGKGGLPPSLVLGVFRRDQWRCKVHGDAGEGENGGLQVHHKGKVRHPASAWLARKGGSNDPNNIVTLCTRAHREIHSRDRAVIMADKE